MANVEINVEITEKTLKEVRSTIKDQEIEVNVLRVGVVGGGCSGFQYQLGFIDDSEVTEDDYILKEEEDLKVVIDKKSLIHMDGTVIDFHEDINKRGFAFTNPNAKSNCGCGSSFSC